MNITYKEKQKTVTVIDEAKCDSCNKKLKSVFNVNDVDDFQFEDAIEISLVGGYGMYFDSSNYRFFFCKTCSDRLLELFPCFKTILK